MKKYSLLLCCIGFFSVLQGDPLTTEEFYLLVFGRRITKRYEDLKQFENELKEFELDKINDECMQGKQESCFVMTKLSEKELQEFFSIARRMKEINRTREKKLNATIVPDFLNKYFPGISLEMTVYFARQKEEALKKAEKKEMKRLAKLECYSTDDKEGLKKYIGCRQKTFRSKYKRLKETYPNRFVWRYWWWPSEKEWSENLRTRKRLCCHYGHLGSCNALKAMRKQRITLVKSDK